VIGVQRRTRDDTFGIHRVRYGVFLVCGGIEGRDRSIGFTDEAMLVSQAGIPDAARDDARIVDCNGHDVMLVRPRDGVMAPSGARRNPKN